MPTLCRDCLRTDAEARRRCAGCGSPRRLAHPELERLSIAHLDADAFYASVEKRDRPELADKPVVVGGGHRGVVTAACYVARTYGVRSAMPMFTALKRCPDAVVIRPDFGKYTTESRRIMERLRALTPLVQPLSLDEAWIDLSGTERLNGGSPAFQLARVQAEIARDIGLWVSIGLAPNKVLAKIASDLDKPRGFAVIGAEEAAAFLAPRSVSLLPGVGPAMARSLEAAGLRTIGQLAAHDPKALARRFGTYGLRLHELAHGRDSRAVNPDQERKSISAETTFNTDLSSLADLRARLWEVCEKTALRSRAAGVAGRVATLKLKTAEFRSITRRRTLATPTQTARGLFAVVSELLAAEATGRVRYRLIGAGLSDLVDSASSGTSAGDSGDLFTPAAPGWEQASSGELSADGEGRTRKAEQAMDALRGRFGDAVIARARSLPSRD